jgi:hypothetical protein
MNNLIIILNDGETYSNLPGSAVVLLGDSGLEKLNNGEDIEDIVAARTYDLTNPVHLRMLADHIEKNR